jgi:CheY-like chemotaxis protein
MGDDSELREVLVNMVFNAIEAMPEGGTLTLSSQSEGENVILKVVDTGVGMYPEVRSRIFDPFFTTKGKAGLGLGLAVSFGIIRRHGGTIEVESQYGRGSEFRVTLPLKQIVETEVVRREVVPQEALTITMSHAGELPPKRLLVVDDEDFVRDLLRDILEGEQCEVTLAADGTEALTLFREQEFDGVFTDVGMPGMSGWELAREIRQLNAGIPIAIITGWGELVGSHEQRAAGVDWVVAKPFTAERIAELVRAINNRLDKKRTGNCSTVAA